MALAEREDRPRVVPVYSFEQLIRNSEAWVREQEDVVSWTRPGRPGEKIEGKEKDPWEVPESWPPESVFSPSAYPSPWPFEPFKKQWWHPQEKFGNFIHTPKLQQYIPQHLLPETLVVHDPYDILGARGNYFNGTPWIAKDDIARIYKLKPSNTKQPREIQDIKEYEEEITRVKNVREAFLAKPHSRAEMPDGMVYQSETTKDFHLGPCKPPVFIVFPSKPPQPPAKTAHLYVTPAARLGSGNHSYVYQAEFEVPRSFLASEEICSECVLQDVKRILEEEDGPNGERRDARWDELSGRYTVKVRGTPARSVMLGDEVHKFKPDSRKVEVVYDGPYRAIEAKVGYQNLERGPYCEHFRKDRIHPLTTKVQVAAKISMEDDDHLYYEANNYRAFPKDFFEHYNGFNLVRPVTEPTPVGAIVPQFYGYYVLDKDDERNKEWADDYLSPILLVEDCGTSIDPDDLSQDDTRECISLFYRMHAVDYYHGSPYRRNIVRQPGPLNEHPLVRQANATAAVPGTSRMGTNWSYRLIDFGRTRHKTKTDYDDYSWTMDWETGKMRSWLRGGSLS
ncbi:hypothetical protein CPB84DRAFT_1765117 [Gymnopilus junonius]|uniref:Uncharacterized protein n=1 Tax=Gymnopilus junonius TaxID=109634 RepID=A0A9P5TSK4_GYMJU|nr:hypothetical protein CPB84DRAFT_1765117 [Gymnopilus junonius]